MVPILTALRALLVTIMAALTLTVVTPAPHANTSDGGHAYIYDSHHLMVSLTYAITERGSAAAHVRRTAYNADGQRQLDDQARPEGVGALAPYNYDDIQRSGQFLRESHPAESPFGQEQVKHDVAERWRVAANRGLAGGITRLSPDEVATGTRLAQLHPERTFSESQHVGAEFVDDLGRSYDALGTPAASKYWNESQFLRSIDTHLLKSNNATVIDLTGFGSSQVSTVRTYVSGLSSAQQSAIIRIGF